MKNRNLTKKQHCYPRCLLKHFSDDQDKVTTYIREANIVCKMNYEKLCASNYSYESDDTIDNILEQKIGNYESKMGAIVDYILKNCASDNFTVTEDQQCFLYTYMWLQYIRTDAGRVNFITMYENLFSYKPRALPIELAEIKNNEDKIKKFNKLFKQEGVLDSYLKKFEKPESMNFHIAISEQNLLTSDNPIIGTDKWKRLVLPISPFLCIEFTDDSIDVTRTLFVKMTSDNTKYLNKATINTANYFIISNEGFSIFQNNYIYNRFRNPNWTFSKPHFK